MVKAIRIKAPGGPEAMEWMDVTVGDPGEGEIRVRHTAVGVNYIDVYHRSGVYPLGSMPHGIGMEGAGVVEAAGKGVSHVKAGDRVAYASPPPGSYAEARVMPAKHVVKLPEKITDETGAVIMLKGMTAGYLLLTTHTLTAGETVLFHAAAGGVGLIFCQWAKAIGANVIGTVGSDDKAKLAKEHGCAHVINYQRENFVERVKEITKGKGVPVVYDSVGKDTWAGSLDCLAPRGLMVSFGNASGNAPPLNIGDLGAKGSLYVTRPTLFTHIATPQDLASLSGALFEVITSGKVKVDINQRYALKDAVKCHQDLEARKTTGQSVMRP
ncbi:MAG: quinone oxidoreductase [Alphaproteobacteria bacterium]|nr:quinone oxidoreductase [Alphaproteobacteria bacterium]